MPAALIGEARRGAEHFGEFTFVWIFVLRRRADVENRRILCMNGPGGCVSLACRLRGIHVLNSWARRMLWWHRLRAGFQVRRPGQDDGPDGCPMPGPWPQNGSSPAETVALSSVDLLRALTPLLQSLLDWFGVCTLRNPERFMDAPGPSRKRDIPLTPLRCWPVSARMCGTGYHVPENRSVGRHRLKIPGPGPAAKR